MRRLSDWLRNLTAPKKMLLGIAVLFVIVAASNSQQPVNLNSSKTSTDAQSQQDQSSSDQSPAPKTPAITTQTVTETQSIPFTATTVLSATLAKGTTKVTTAGVNGSETLTYQVTDTDGQQTNKQLVNTTVTAQPVTQVTSVGTYVAPAPKAAAPAASQPGCDPNYSGACVPNVYPEDVDCAGGSGNGPYYVQGPVRVIGVDRYGLDRDGNGIGCE